MGNAPTSQTCSRLRFIPMIPFSWTRLSFLVGLPHLEFRHKLTAYTNVAVPFIFGFTLPAQVMRNELSLETAPKPRNPERFQFAYLCFNARLNLPTLFGFQNLELFPIFLYWSAYHYDLDPSSEEDTRSRSYPNPLWLP